MGLASAATAIGDKICIFFGGQVLYVLRERGEGKHEFIGECYVHGLMEAFDEEAEYLASVEEFVLAWDADEEWCKRDNVMWLKGKGVSWAALWSNSGWEDCDFHLN